MEYYSNVMVCIANKDYCPHQNVHPCLYKWNTVIIYPFMQLFGHVGVQGIGWTHICEFVWSITTPKQYILVHINQELAVSFCFLYTLELLYPSHNRENPLLHLNSIHLLDFFIAFESPIRNCSYFPLPIYKEILHFHLTITNIWYKILQHEYHIEGYM